MRYQIKPTLHTLIPTLTENFNKERNVQTMTDPGRRSFQVDKGNSQFLLRQASIEVPERSSCRFKDFLLYHTEHPKKASSHVSVEDNKSTPFTTTTTRLCSSIGPWSGQYENMSPDSASQMRSSLGVCFIHFSGARNIQSTQIWGKWILTHFQLYGVDCKKGTLGYSRCQRVDIFL